jgi:uroporphyrinogen decarboxylase
MGEQGKSSPMSVDARRRVEKMGKVSQSGMTPQKRVELTLHHKEPDRVPIDLGSTSATGISARAYEALVDYLGLQKPVRIIDVAQQLAEMDEETLCLLGVDTRGQSLNLPSPGNSGVEEDERYSYFSDRWGIKYRRPRSGGYYYDMFGHPLCGPISKDDIRKFDLPSAESSDPALGPKLAEWAGRDRPPAIVLEATEGGLLELCFWLRGFEDFYCDLAVDPRLANYLIDRLLEFKIECWRSALGQVGKYITVAWEADDLGIQSGPMISPETYRKHVKPRHRKLLTAIRDAAPSGISIAFHSCGSVKEFIPDLIDIGVDALNPVQVSAADMDSHQLKAEFGKDIAFWGGGVDTQHVLPKGTVTQVADEVRRRMDDLAPEGGFVFAAVHNIQADVSPRNLLAMWETFQSCADY